MTTKLAKNVNIIREMALLKGMWPPGVVKVNRLGVAPVL